MFKTCKDAPRKRLIAHDCPAVCVGLPTVLELVRGPRTIKMGQKSPPSWMGSWRYRNVGLRLSGFTAVASRG